MEQENSDLQAAKRFENNDDWKWAKSKLSDMMEAYKHAALTGTDTAVGREYKRRKDVIAVITSWIDYIEGTADIPFEVTDDNKLIQRFEDRN